MIPHGLVSGSQVRWAAASLEREAFSAKYVLSTRLNPFLVQGDFNGDGHSDILFQNATTGELEFWQMDGSEVVDVIALPSMDPGWRTAGTGDFDSDALAALVKAGVDFVVLAGTGAAAAPLASESVGRVMALDSELDDTYLRLLGDLGLDALVVAAPEAPLTVERLLAVRRLSALARTPLLANAKPDIDEHTNGRGHWPGAFSCLLAGGGVRGGQVYGKTDERAGRVIDNPVSVPDFNATIAQALGLPLDERIYSDSGRPFTVADKGKPITALLA